MISGTSDVGKNAKVPRSSLLIDYPIADMVLSFAPHSVDEINTALDGFAGPWDLRRHAVPNRF